MLKSNLRNIFLWNVIALVPLSAIANVSSDYTLFDPIIDVCDLIEKYYVRQVDNEELLAGAINGLLHELDMHCEYIPAEQVDEFQKLTSGTYEGIGIGIGTQNDALKVISPFEGSPAHKAGLRAGDIILEVNEQETKGWSDTQAVQELTGPADTDVKLKILRSDNSEKEITITRKSITVPTVKGWRRNSIDGAWDYLLDDQEKIGYIRLTQFTAEAVDDFRRAVQATLDADALAVILDLRSNPGGLMSSAIAMVDSLIDIGTIVSTRGAHSADQVEKATSSGTFPHFPLVVLINKGSASASEIVAGALQDNNRAIIIGQRSWGKGSVQRIFKLPNSGAALKITTDYYYLPNGRCVHKLPKATQWGVDPDIEEELAEDNFDALGNLFTELMTTPEDVVTTDALDESNDEILQRETADQQLKKGLLTRLLALDNQIHQGFKQCKGLIRTRSTLKSIAGTMSSMQDSQDASQ